MFSSQLAGKSRRRAAIVAGALAGALAPLAAHASMTVTLSLSPTAAGIATTSNRYYETPSKTADVPVYVYATVTGTTASDFQGLEYAYYNISDALTTSASMTATIDASQSQTGAFSSAFAGRTGGSNTTGTSSQFGAIVNNPNGIALGDATGNTIGNLIKADENNGDKPVFGAAGTSATFLLETIMVKPTSVGTFTASTTSTLRATRFYANNLTASQFSTTYGATVSEANWNEDSTVNSGNGSITPTQSQRHVTTTPAGSGAGQDPTAGTFSVTTGSPAGVSFINALVGDANGDGTVDINDVTNTILDYTHTGQTWAQGDYGGDGTVDINDVTNVILNYTQSLNGLNPLVLSDLAMISAENPGNTVLSSALASVPEPASLGILTIAGASLLMRRRRGSV